MMFKTSELSIYMMYFHMLIFFFFISNLDNCHWDQHVMSIFFVSSKNIEFKDNLKTLNLSPFMIS